MGAVDDPLGTAAAELGRQVVDVRALPPEREQQSCTVWKKRKEGRCVD